MPLCPRVISVQQGEAGPTLLHRDLCQRLNATELFHLPKRGLGLIVLSQLEKRIAQELKRIAFIRVQFDQSFSVVAGGREIVGRELDLDSRYKAALILLGGQNL